MKGVKGEVRKEEMSGREEGEKRGGREGKTVDDSRF